MSPAAAILDPPDARGDRRPFPLELSPMQEKILTDIPSEVLVLFLIGGRGSGKTTAALADLIRHVIKFGPLANVLVVRKSHKGLRNIEARLHQIFGSMYGSGYSYNGNEKRFMLPNGAKVHLDASEEHSSRGFDKHQGVDYSMLFVDEAGQYLSPSALDQIVANVRDPRVDRRIIFTANPGPGNAWIKKRTLEQAESWEPYTCSETGLKTAYIHSTYVDNTFVDSNVMKAQIEAATASDLARRDSWLSGDFNALQGSYLSSVWKPDKIVIPDMGVPEDMLKGLRLGYDHGSRS